MIDNDFIPTRKPNIQWREIGGEGILLDPATTDYAEINEFGLAIWKQIDGQKTVSEIIEQLRTEFDTEDESLTADTLDFLTELHQRDLIGSS